MAAQVTDLETESAVATPSAVSGPVRIASGNHGPTYVLSSERAGSVPDLVCLSTSLSRSGYGMPNRPR